MSQSYDMLAVKQDFNQLDYPMTYPSHSIRAVDHVLHIFQSIPNSLSPLNGAHIYIFYIFLFTWTASHMLPNIPRPYEAQLVVYF